MEKSDDKNHAYWRTAAELNEDWMRNKDVWGIVDALKQERKDLLQDEIEACDYC